MQFEGFLFSSLIYLKLVEQGKHLKTSYLGCVCVSHWISSIIPLAILAG